MPRFALPLLLLGWVGCHDVSAIQSALPNETDGLPGGRDASDEGDVVAIADADFREGEGGDADADAVVGDASVPCQDDRCSDVRPCEAGTPGCIITSTTLYGVVRPYFSLDPMSFAPNVKVVVTSQNPFLTSNPSDANGNYSVSNVIPASLVELQLELPPGDSSAPAAIVTRYSLSRIPNQAAVQADLPLITFAWMAQVASQCGIFATSADALANVNLYFIPRSTIFGELDDEAGNPVSGIPRDAINVNIGGFSNFDGNPMDTDARPAKVCFLARDPGSNQYAGTTSPISDASGRFVMFRLRNAGTMTGQGAARVQATGFVSQNLTLQSSGNIGVVRLTRGMDPAPAVVERSFAADVYPLFNELGCAGCHTPGGPGFVQSATRCGLHLDLSGTPDQVYASLLAQGDPDGGLGDSATCGGGASDGAASDGSVRDGGIPCSPPQRVCTSSAETSLVLKKPLAEAPPEQPDHPNTSFNDTNDPNYQAILQWIQQGARR